METGATRTSGIESGKGERGAKEMVVEDSHRIAVALGFQTGATIPKGTGEELWERDAPHRLPWRYQSKSGVQDLRRNAPARAPRGVRSMWARVPRAPRNIMLSRPL